MTKLERIENEIASLEGDELTAFLSWLDDWRWRKWDEQIEKDSEAGRLDGIIQSAEAEIAAGRTRDL